MFNNKQVNNKRIRSKESLIQAIMEKWIMTPTQQVPNPSNPPNSPNKPNSSFDIPGVTIPVESTTAIKGLNYSTVKKIIVVSKKKDYSKK